MTSTPALDRMRGDVLDRMERADRLFRWSIAGAAVLELLMLGLGLAWVDFGDPLQRLVFVMFMLVYMILILGLIALGIHVSRSTDRLLSVIGAQAG